MNRWLPIAFSIVILSLVSGYGWQWLAAFEETAVVNILASSEPDLALPVYAQFLVTQSVLIHDVASLTRLVVPVYITDPSLPFNVSLWWNERDRTLGST